MTEPTQRSINPATRLTAQHAAARSALLELAESPDEHLRQTATTVLAAVESEPRITTRHCHPDHLTASALVITPDLSQVLLHLHAKVGRWLQFGGHLEMIDEDPGQAAVRETQEEAGITAQLWRDQPVAVDVHPAPCGARNHLDLQYIVVTPQRPPSGTIESLDLRWFPVEKLPPSADQSVRRLVAYALAVLRPSPSS